jgi:hypothetical protein
VIASHLFALLLALSTLLLAAGVGSALLNWLALPWGSRLERWLFGVAVGLGVLAYTVLGLGLGSVRKGTR